MWVKEGRMATNETESHRQLKQLALEWARANAFAIAAAEVRVPRSGYRADVAGNGTALPAQRD